MKIGYDAKRVFHNWRGLGNYSRDLIRGLKHFYPDNEYILYTPEYKDSRAKQFEAENSDLKIVTPSGIFGKLFPSVWRSNVSTVFKTDELDIYHGLSHELPPKKKNSKTKMVVTVHDLIVHRYPEYFNSVDRKVYMAKVKYACKTADLIIAICEQTKKDLIDILKVPEGKIRVAYQSCNQDFFDLIPKDEINKKLANHDIYGEYFLYVGAFEERKNVLALIEAYYHYGTSKQLVLAGRGKSYLTEIKEKIKSFGLEKDVVILENIDQVDLPALYQGAFAFCFPSFFEGFGIPIIESLFSGTPVITTDGSCFPEVAGPGGLYCNPNNPFEITKAMDKLSNDKDLYEKLVREGKEHVQRFLPKNTNKRLIEIYQELMS